jgi:hypothetical protein
MRKQPCRRDGALREYAAREKEKVDAQRRTFQSSASTERDILRLLREYHSITNPSHRVLKMIAQTMASSVGLKIGREPSRRKELLIGWMNQNYDDFAPLIDKLVFTDESGQVYGDIEWLRKYSAEHPEDTDVSDWLGLA